MTTSRGEEPGTQDDELLADLFDELLQEILEGRTPDLDGYLPDRPDLRSRVAKTWALACSVAGRREPSRPVLGGYEIVKVLGHGGMGTVYLARHELLQREVAIKVLPHSLAMSPRAKERFLDEAKALARIRHQNVVHIHRILDHTEMLAFEMEYVGGPNLQRLVQELRAEKKRPTAAALAAAIGVPEAALGTRSPVEWFVATCARIARALAVVHRHGLVHRDVKPSNILLRTDGTPVLADFGLARLGDLEATQTGAFAGTPVYAAPERLRGGDAAVDARTDVYSLGVTLYELLTLNAPFAGSSTHEVLRRIESGSLPALRRAAPNVSRDLETVVQKAMEPDPRHRYATADELADDLDRLLALEPIRARPAGPLRRLGKLVRRNHRTVLAAAAGAVVVAAVTWPLVAHAQLLQDSRRRAAEQLHAARTMLLSPEALHGAWTLSLAGTSLQPLQNLPARAAHLAALESTAAAYDGVVALDPADAAARRERDAVRATLAVQQARAQGRPAASVVADLPPAFRGAAARLLGVDAPAAADLGDQDRFAIGLMSFLVGDSAASHDAWDVLDSTLLDQPLFAACRALQLATDGYPERAYARLFHASRTFPEADVLAMALADAALVMGDTSLARDWLEKTASPGTEDLTWARRRLLEADLLAATGSSEAAASIYRELSDHDRSDVVPGLRMARLALEQGHHESARRLLVGMLRRRPEQAHARRLLATLDLQRRNLAGYLQQVRYALAQDLERLPRAAANQLSEILWLGGLDLGTGAAAAGRPPRGPALPLANWLPPHVCAAITRAMQVLAVVDHARGEAAAADTRPGGVLLRTAWLTAARVPEVTALLGPKGQLAVLGGMPALLGLPADRLSDGMARFQRILGNEAAVVYPESLVPPHMERAPVIYAARLVAAGDVDGDTLDDFCLACDAGPGHEALARIELRAVADGSLIRVLSAGPEPRRFGRGLAVLGDGDGDHCNDLLIGSPAARPAAGGGAVELHSGRTGHTIWTVTGAERGFGESLAGIGDVDGDGVPDFVVGAPTAPEPGPGRAFVCSGRDGSRLGELAAEQGGAWFGSLVVAVGDVDADGATDVLVSTAGAKGAGYAAVFSGRTRAVLLTFAGETPTDNFGYSAIGLGDIDGDGHDDFAIGAPGLSEPARHTGTIDILSGRTGKLLRVLRGERLGDEFGVALCTTRGYRRDSAFSLVVGSRRGGPGGAGYIRVFDVARGFPLQTLAANPAMKSFGAALVDLGDRSGDGLADIGVPMITRSGVCLLWSVSYALVTNR